MVGKHSGVAAQLRTKQPILTGTHCVVHRLALAASQAGEKVKFIADVFKPTLRQLFYFYENSAVRLSALKEIQQLLDSPELKLKKPLDTHWLSHDAACQTLKKVLPAVITSLERETVERGEALAIGLSRVVKRYQFTATLYMMCDVLPKVSRLSRVFQLSSIDVFELNNQLNSTLESLEKLLSTPGEHFMTLDSDLDNLCTTCNIQQHTPEAKEHFLKAIHEPFIKAMLQNIENRLPDTKLFANFKVFDPKEVPDSIEAISLSNYGVEEMKDLAEFYGAGMSVLDPNDLQSEWLDFRVYMLTNCVRMTVAKLLSLLSRSDTTTASVYPNLSKLAQIFLALPISTADCERGFSTMKRKRLD